MLNIEIDESLNLAILSPQDQLTEADFQRAANIVDPYIESGESLKGLVIATESFPGWESFQAMVSHIQFVRDHHRKIGKVALVTDSVAGNLAESVGAHFISAQVNHFPYADLDEAKRWVAGS